MMRFDSHAPEDVRIRKAEIGTWLVPENRQKILCVAGSPIVQFSKEDLSSLQTRLQY